MKKVSDGWLRKAAGGPLLKRLLHRMLWALAWASALMLTLLLLCGSAEEADVLPEGNLSEAEAVTLPDDEAEPSAESAESEENKKESLPAVEAEASIPEECAEPEKEKPAAEPSPEPAPKQGPKAAPAAAAEATPVPMFDIIDGRTIYLSITEEEFIEIADFLREGLKVNDAALAGIMANLQGESGFNPHKVGDDGEAYGICQWRGPRLDQMVEFCGEQDLNPVSLEGQLSFLIHDLINNYIYAYDQIRLCEDSENGALQATFNFCAYYESPADPETESADREEWTKLLIYPKLNELSKND